MAKLKGLQIVEGYFVSHVVWNLHHEGVLQLLAQGDSVAAIADQQSCDPQLLRTLLEFVHQTTDLLRRQKGEYRINPRYLPYRAVGFHLDKFIGAYGNFFGRPEDLLHPAPGRNRVNEKFLAQAFLKVESLEPSFIAKVILELGCTSLLDLGCGPATLLRSLCLANESFGGWGIDLSDSMCREARRQIARLKLTSRLQIIHADARKVGSVLTPAVRRRIDAVHLSSLLNEFCDPGYSGVIDLLRKLKKLFPNRLLFVVDYYGKLAWQQKIDSAYRHTLLHDLIQAVSSQGIPPPDLQSWLAIYEAAGCVPEKVYEGESEGVEWFLHIVRL